MATQQQHGSRGSINSRREKERKSTPDGKVPADYSRALFIVHVMSVYFISSFIIYVCIVSPPSPLLLPPPSPAFCYFCFVFCLLFVLPFVFLSSIFLLLFAYHDYFLVWCKLYNSQELIFSFLLSPPLPRVTTGAVSLYLYEEESVRGMYVCMCWMLYQDLLPDLTRHTQ